MAANAKIKVVGYARVSTVLQIKGKEFNSIDAQKSIISEYVASHPEMELAEMFSDPGKSGKDMNRPGMQALIRRIKQGDIKCVLCYRLDRISRDKFDYFKFEELVRNCGVSVHYTNDFNPDDSPMGKFVQMLMVWLAQLERNQTIQRITDKHIALLKEGYHAGGYPPLGYLCGDKKNTLIIDENAAPHVREIYKLFSKGKKPSEIAQHMAAKYGKVPERKTRNGRIYGGTAYCENFVRRVLAKPIYAGYVYRNTKEKGLELFEGLHKAIVGQKAVARCAGKAERGKNNPAAGNPHAKAVYSEKIPILLLRRGNDLRGVGKTSQRQRAVLLLYLFRPQ